MVSSGRFRRLAPLGAVLWMLTLSGASVNAQDATCVVDVDPRAGVGGSVFVFSGSGYTPTQLKLQKDGDKPINHDLNVGESDPWDVTVRSRVGDEGSWTATFSDPTVPCTASVKFRVTLNNTDALDDLVAATRSASAPVALYLAVIAVGLGGGLIIGRRIHQRGRV